jgi:hypothetical protein
LISRVAVVIAVLLSAIAVLGLIVWQEVRWAGAIHVYVPVSLESFGDTVQVRATNIDDADSEGLDWMNDHSGWLLFDVDDRGVARRTSKALECAKAVEGVICVRSEFYGRHAALLDFNTLDVKTADVESIDYVHMRVLEGGASLIEGFADADLGSVGSVRRMW